MKLTLSILFLFIIHLSFGQSKNFKFAKKIHNFGTIEEDSGSAKHTFYFTNIGKEPIKIKKVKASCGCTTPEWSKDEIFPGDTGIVSASYNPKNRPGHFRKTLTIISSNEEKIILTIRGEVNPKKNVKQIYPYISSGLRFKKEFINLNSVLKDTPLRSKISIYNELDEDVHLLNEIETPLHITLIFKDSILKSKEAKNIIILYDASLVDDWGQRIDELKFKIGKNESIIKIKSNIIENFSTLTKIEHDNAPRISLSKKTLHFGTITKGKTAKSKIIYTNTGKRDLIIRKISATCGCTIVKSKKNTIAPGKSGKIIVTINTSEKDYNQSNMINIISNDPKSPLKSILIRANIIE